MAHKTTIVQTSNQTNVVLTKTTPTTIVPSVVSNTDNVVLTEKQIKEVELGLRKGDKGDQGDVGPDGPPGIQGPAGNDGAFTAADELALEMEIAFKSANINNFRELIFTSGLLTNLSIYTDSGKSTKLFNKDLTYDVNDTLTTIVLTRISDSVTLTKNLIYNLDGSLKSIEAV